MSQPIITRPRFRYGLSTVMELFDIGPWVALLVLLGTASIFVAGVVFFIRGAPPATLTMSSGPEGSMFQRTATQYARALNEFGVTVNIVPSSGSLENLRRLSDPTQNVDLALMQSGIIDEDTDLGSNNIVSLGVIANQPIFFFYRGAAIERLSFATGKKIAIGPEGTGARKIALKLLELNGIEPGDESGTELLDLGPKDASMALQRGEIDAAFVMTENLPITELRKLNRAKEIRLLSFKNAAAYTRKVDYLNVLVLPQGVLDFGLNLPAEDVSLVGPMIELIATENLHPVLSDLILDAATTIHAKPGLFQKRGDFPQPIEQSIRLSEDASRYYKSGKTFLYRYLPFWLASVINRFLIVFVPMAVLLIPLIRSLPVLFRWRSQIKIRRLYRELLQVEERFQREHNEARKEDLREDFDRIDRNVHRMKVRPAFADQFYSLRVHIDYVRGLMST